MTNEQMTPSQLLSQGRPKGKRSNQSVTLKALIILGLVVLLMVPMELVKNLIRERHFRQQETAWNITSQWSGEQTFAGPILTMPAAVAKEDTNKKKIIQSRTLNVTPEKLNIRAEIQPEERYYGIYKTILYRSVLHVEGYFTASDWLRNQEGEADPSFAQLRFGVSDLRGIADNIVMEVNGKTYTAEATGSTNTLLDEVLSIPLDLAGETGEITFKGEIRLNGSSALKFIPVGKTTNVRVGGQWADPGFSGNFSPDHQITENDFTASWNVLKFNRNIPDSWLEGNLSYNLYDWKFGVTLVDTVDQYQQNTRAAKYALMFILLTFVVFFFVEQFNRKAIHPLQYLLVGIALVLFYSLLLSLSERIGFGFAYLVSGAATVALIGCYAASLFKNGKQVTALVGILALLYGFLYMILQLEDVALLIGSIGMFLILGLLMYFSNKINWYKQEPGSEKKL